MKKIPSVTYLLVVLASLTFSQVCAADDTLNNASIIELQKLNLGDTVIIEKIKASKCSFDTSVNGLTALKAANVSSPVIAAMLTAPAVTAAPTGNPNDPAAPHSPGIWVLAGENGQSKMIQVAPEIPAEISHGGFIGPWGIGKIATTARLSGTNSQLQLTQAKPEFYVYFNNATMEFSGATTPAEIVLAQFKVLGGNDKHNPNQRAVDVAEHGAYGGSYGVDQKAVRLFDVTPVAAGIYKIVPNTGLADGEYALCAGAGPVAMTGQYQFFTFGIHTK